MSEQVICTIVAKNYLAFARTLCDSFLRQHPAGRCFVLCTDDVENYVNPDEEPFELVRLDEIGMPDTREMCFKYDITEMATAAKPFFAGHLMEKHALDKLLYLDPDILVLDSLDSLYEQLEDCDVLLTPHLDEDYPDDGFMPDDAHIMKSGINNLGFIGLRSCRNTRAFLAWWQHKLADKCVIDHAKGYFVDQRFVDLAVSLFPNFRIERDPALNVAYWNLHSRMVSHDGERFRVNGQPLVFYHFSGYRLDRPEYISSHQTRLRLADLPGLAQLFRHYRELLAANAHHTVQNWPYQHARYTNGKPIRYSERKVFRDAFAGSFGKDPFVRRNHSGAFRRRVLRERLKRWLVRRVAPLFR